MMKLFVGALLFGLAASFPHEPKAGVCGYDSCTKSVPNKLNVHMVPHTHDDVGWLKTVDQYYYGSKSNIQNAGVQYIIDSVVDTLSKDPAKKFVYVETAFFWKWWVEQTEETQNLVKNLVANGQLEFIGGAWSMNDEATTLYHTTIDQFTWGLRRLNDTFGSCGQPRVGWQIDPFGHSKEQAALMAQYNFDGLFFARLDYQDRDNRLKTKTMETMWEADQNLGGKADILTGALYAFYGNPPGFCFDINCSDEPMIDNPDLPDYNVPRRVDEFVSFLNEQKSYYVTNNVMITMGSDFMYQDAGIYFKNMDKLIKGLNELHPELNVFYSTPSCYVKALNDANVTWTTKQDDYFPYGSGPHTYWTGYFTSRPTLKRFERQAHTLLQAGKQLATISNQADADDLLTIHREAQGILQHHDAVAGTEKQAVAEDYARLLQIGVAATERVVSGSLSSLQRKNQDSPFLTYDSCPLRNISQCATTETSQNLLVTVYNPLSRVVNHTVRIPVANATYSVLDPNGDEVVSQLVEISDHLARLPGRVAKTNNDLYFIATDLPPLGYKSYYLTKNPSNKKHSRQISKKWVPEAGQDITVGDDNLSITFDNKNNLMKSINTGREVHEVTQSLEYYVGAVGDNGAEERRSSGAYIFRPTTEDSIAISDGSDVTVVRGPLLFEVHQVFSDWATQIVRHFYDSDVVEFEWLVGPIPINGEEGKEVVSKFYTPITSDGEVVTDTNGRNNLRRKRNVRPDWDLQVNEPVAGNYYPIVLDISIDNGTDRLAVITDRAQGGGSIQHGELELMVHRRLLHDDAFGVGEPINETAYGQGLVARGTHYILLGSADGTASTKSIRLLEQQKIMDSLVVVSNVDGKSFSSLQQSLNLEFAGLTASLPDEVQLLTLEPWKDGSVLLRLENIFTVEQSPASVTVDITKLFSTFNVISARETTLAANKFLDEASRLQWRKKGSDTLTPGPYPKGPLDLAAVTLAPKQIRTFIVKVSPK